MNCYLKFAGIVFISFINICYSKSQNKSHTNLVEDFKPVSIPVYKFETAPLISLTGFNFQLATLSGDLKNMAVARRFPKGDSEVKDIVLITLADNKESILLDTQSMIRYGRPNGFLYDMRFNEQNQLVVKIGDGMDGTSILTIDIEKKEVIKDEYFPDYSGEEEQEEQDTLFNRKVADLKRIYPKKTIIQLSDLAYKLMAIDSVGYLCQGILPNDNSIFFLPHREGNLRLIHSFSDPKQIDNIDGFWGTSSKVYYLIKDKKHEYFFRYDIKSNAVTLLEKFPPHSHFTHMLAYKLKNREFLLSFEVEGNTPQMDETLKLFKYHKGMLHKIEDYPILKDIHYLDDLEILLLYYLKDGKPCLDVRSLK